ncbi:MAG TPA: DUF4339 domain-containing protein [Polyangiaceae bacterium]|nr:DUF4339 domain-containing protein [Polyangiaceae bacterium]
MANDSRVVDKGWDLPEYTEQTADDAVTLSVSAITAEWLVNTKDSVVVPMSTADVVEALRAHKLTERSLVWRHGMPAWTSIERVPSLKLAARLPATLGPSRPSHPAQAAVASSPSAAPPPPSAAPFGRAAASPSRPPVSPSQTPRPSSSRPIGLSPRSTLPFGIPGPNPSRPASAKPSSPPRATPPRSEEPEVLAVYDRPAATISFALSLSEPAVLPPPVPERPVAAQPAAPSPPKMPPPPQTLAPTTTDARSAPPRPYNPDLSVVAASQFREVQRSSKRRLLVSSLASAAAASALTLWLSGNLPWSRSAESKAPPRPAESPAAQVVAAAPPAPAPVAVTPAPALGQAEAAAATSAVPSPAPLAQAMAAALTRPKPAAAKPKAASAAHAVARASEPARTAAAGDAKAGSNPYDVKLEDDSAQPAKPRGLIEMMQESERPSAEAEKPEASAATGSSAPGF